MSCTAAEGIRKHTWTFIDLWEPVDVKFRPTACGAGANSPRPDTLNLEAWHSLINGCLRRGSLVVTQVVQQLGPFTPTFRCDHGISACEQNMRSTGASTVRSLFFCHDRSITIWNVGPAFRAGLTVNREFKNQPIVLVQAEGRWRPQARSAFFKKHFCTAQEAKVL